MSAGRHLRRLLLSVASVACAAPDATDTDMPQETDDTEQESDTVPATDDTSSDTGTSRASTDDTDVAGWGDNVLNGTNTGGPAAVVAIAGYDADGVSSALIPYSIVLEPSCAGWRPHGTLCDEDPHTHSPALSQKAAPSGATWRAQIGLTPQPITGVLVVDACSDGSCASITFDTARVFQMFSDGKATAVRVSVHPSRDDTPPAWDDPQWKRVTGFAQIGSGHDVNGDGTLVARPTSLHLAHRNARYVRLEARNDGSQGSPEFIELRAVKLFDTP